MRAQLLHRIEIPCDLEGYSQMLFTKDINRTGASTRQTMHILHVQVLSSHENVSLCHTEVLTICTWMQHFIASSVELNLSEDVHLVLVFFLP